MLRRRRLELVLLTLAAWAVVVSPASAYIDAGSTSLIFQYVVAGLAAGGMAVRLFWSRLSMVFRRSSGDEVTAETSAPEA